MNKIKRSKPEQLRVGEHNNKHYCYMQVSFMKDLDNPNIISVDTEVDNNTLKSNDIQEIVRNLRKLADELESQYDYSTTDWINEMLNKEI